MASVRAALKKDEAADPAPEGEASAGPAREPRRRPDIEEIRRLMAEAEARAKAARSEDSRAALWQVVTFALVWGGIIIALGAALLIFISEDAVRSAGLVFAIGLGALAIILIASAALRLFSPVLLAGVMLRRVSGKSAPAAVELAGSDMLAALGIAEKVLDADDDARLVTRRDGVVAYANAAYVGLAKEAGVIGPAGLPPRIDRLFAQQGAEATKLFRLCRAAKSAAPAL